MSSTSSSASSQSAAVVAACSFAAGALATATLMYAGRKWNDKQKRNGEDKPGTIIPPGSDPKTNPYETNTLLHEYLLMHYGTKKELLPYEQVSDCPINSIEFPKNCATQCIELVKNTPQLDGEKTRVFDIGCAVGRSSFELARYFENVVGLDYSQNFIDAANELKKTGSMAYQLRMEGDITAEAVAQVDPALDRSRVSFIQGDACNLSVPLHGQFGLIMGANLLCRLPYPRRFLASLPSLVIPYGYVCLFSPYTWLEQYTNKDEWIGGHVENGVAIRSFDVLKELMEPYFKLVEQKDMSFFIRETARKNQWSLSHLTVWQRQPN